MPVPDYLKKRYCSINAPEFDSLELEFSRDSSFVNTDCIQPSCCSDVVFNENRTDLAREVRDTPSISDGESVMNHFLEKLNQDLFPLDKEPISETGEMLDETFIHRQLESYEKLLSSPFMKELEKEKILRIEKK